VRARLLAPENRKWWTLAAVSVGLFMIMLDNTVVNVALPEIGRSLRMDERELEWVVVSYALTFATLMLTGGKLADLFGRRLLFLAGLAVFTGSSLACALAPTAEFLIAARAVQGIGSAFMNPATLGIITATFPPRQRGTAIGIWAGVSAMALAIGPLVGGLLTDHISWHWIFYINVPVGIVGLLVAPIFIDESRDTSLEQRLDVPGLVSSGAGLFALTYALIDANTYGWTSARILALFAIAALALTAFVVLELRQRAPMLDLSLFRNGTFAGANVSMLLVSLAMFGIFFFNSLFIQRVLGFSAVEAGATFLPMTVLIVVVAPVAGKLTDQVGPRWLIAAGMTLLSASLVLFAQLDQSSDFWDIVPGLLAGGFGMALTMTPTTAAAMGSVATDKAGVGSAVLNSMRQVGGSFGIAVMGAVVQSQIHVGPRSAAFAEQFVSGYHHALYVAAAIALTGALVAASTVRKVRHAEAAAAA
jgi:EmrB/QacA subfamily drug resistance transporter